MKKRVYTGEQVWSAVNVAADNLLDIIRADRHRKVCLVPVLNGGAVFGSLVLQILTEQLQGRAANVLVREVQTTSYKGTERGEVELLKMIPEYEFYDVVVLLDDICDSGHTIKKLTEVFTGRGSQVVSMVLLDRGAAERVASPTFAAIKDSRSGWWSGYGMDDPTGGGRNDLFLSIWE
jgi:hypoxanthine-guanine phosphoribosyltransferase